MKRPANGDLITCDDYPTVYEVVSTFYSFGTGLHARELGTDISHWFSAPRTTVVERT